MKANHAIRQRILIAVALMILSVYAILAVLQARAARTRLIAARGDLAEVNQKLKAIKRFKQAPRVASLELEPPAEIPNRIAAALQAAGLEPSMLLKEQPLDPRRIQRSDFELRSTTIELAPVTLTQIVKFCESLRNEQTGSVIRDLTLPEPQNGASGDAREKWAAQLILTQMIFSPKSR